MHVNDPDESAGEMLSPSDMQRLRSRIQQIQESGLATPSQKLFELATQKSPYTLMTEFFAGASPQVSQAMQDAVTSLLGSLPPFEFDAQMTTTGDKLAALMLQLQMTGYMLRNAEYVLMVRKILQLKTRSVSEYRAAFDRIDLDGSGYIEVGEIETLLREVYKGEDAPSFEVASFLTLFDADADGKVSWDEFANLLGAIEEDSNIQPLGDAADGNAAPRPPITGTVTVRMDDGSEMEMDADAYMEQLAAEAQSLRQELSGLAMEEAERQAALSGSISSYVASLPEYQLKGLSSGISDDVVGAMRLLVQYILRAPDGDGSLAKDQSVTMEQAKLQTLCLYQLVLGYRLREAEATGEASDAIGS